MRFSRGAHRILAFGVLPLVFLALSCGGDDGDASTSASDDANDTGSPTDVDQDALWNFVEDGRLFTYDDRLCAAPTIIRAVDSDRLDEIMADRATADEAEVLYDAFADCRSMNLIVMSVQGVVPDLRIEQSKCFVDAAPEEAASKDRFLAGVQGKPIPEMEPAVQDQLIRALQKCFTAPQIEAVAAAAAG